MGSSLSLSIMYFTFQSGSIQIQLLLSAPPTNQTLHSNLVLFKCSICESLSLFEKPLHSNLVLFKSMKKAFVWSPVSPFTFQSGSIQMRL